MLEERDYFSSIEKTRSALDRLLPTLRAVTDPALKDIYVTKVSERTGVRPETLVQEISQEHRAPAPTPMPRPRRRPVPRIPKLGPERTLLLLMLKDRTWVERAAERIGPSDLEDPIYRAIFEALIIDPDLQAPPEDMDPVAVQRLESLMEDPEDPTPSGKVFAESIAKIQVAQIDAALARLDDEIRGASDDAKRVELVKEKARLTAERAELGLDWRMSARNALRKERDGTTAT